MDLKTLKNEDVSIEHADGYPTFFEMTNIGFTNRLFGTELPAYATGMSFFRKGEVDYISLLSDQQTIGKRVLDMYMSNPVIITELYSKWLSRFQQMQQSYKEHFEKNLSALNDSELAVEIGYIYKLFKDEVSMPGFIDGFMFFADKRFHQLVEEYCTRTGINKNSLITSTLLASIEPSFINDEENDLKKIVAYIKDKNLDVSILDRLVQQESELLLKLNKHLDKFSWFKSSYAGYRKYEISDVIEELKTLLTSNIESNKAVFEENLAIKNKMIESEDFDEELIAIVRLSDLLIKWQDQRKEYTLRYVSLIHKIIEEIASRKQLDIEVLKFSSGSELIDILNGKLDPQNLKKRIDGCLFVYENGNRISSLTEDEATSFIKRISTVDVQEVSEIKGMVASSGIVQGIVKIVTTVKNLEKINEGDVLVAPMTRPEHLAGMKKAAAIVTDDGGITCHAAIVSRELKKPCVIGTKIATKVLKDGDLVEVNANVGLIKLI